MPISATLFRNPIADRRISMEVYADGLIRALRANCKDVCVRECRPWVPDWLAQGNWRMRISRFGVYPLLARTQRSTLNHILDHGYGHLLYAVDPARTIVTVHDVIPLVRWKGEIPGLPPSRAPLLNLLSFSSLRRAAHLLADSENTRRDLIRLCRCDPGKITVVHPGVDPGFRPYSQAEKVRARKALGFPMDDGCRVLITGSQLYKNHRVALKAFAQLRQKCQRPLALLHTGPADPELAQVADELKITTAVRSLGIVPRDMLPALYNCVDCLLFPSHYEGFGWPPLEAMACGTPVVVSNAGSLREVIGDGGLMCEPCDEDGLAQAMYRVLTVDELRQELIRRGLERVREFTWERTAEQTFSIYRQVVRKGC